MAKQKSCILDLRKFSGYRWGNQKPWGWKPSKPETPDKKVIILKPRLEPEAA